MCIKAVWIIDMSSTIKTVSLNKVERRKTISLLLTTSLLLTSCAPAIAQGTPTPEKTPTPPEPLATPTLIHNTPTPTPDVNTIRNLQTGTVYQVVPNPEGKPGKCVQLSKYSSSNQQDVFGAAVALGPNPGKYNDYPRFEVYGVGTFTTDSMPNPDKFKIVPPGTIVCED